jgi:dCTP deaminase
MIILRKNYEKMGIRVKPEPPIGNEHVSCDLSVGRVYMEAGNAQPYEFKKPYKLRPARCIVVKTREHFSVPDGVFGILCSKGSLAGRGLMVPNTKIDPRFAGELDIAIYNAGQRTVMITQGMRFCTVVFHQLEAMTNSDSRTGPHLADEKRSWLHRMWDEHAALIIGGIITAVISIGGAAAAVYFAK